MSQKQSDNRHWPKQIPHDIRLSTDLRIAYQQIYDLLDAHTETQKKLNSAMNEIQNLKAQQNSSVPRGSGPTDSMVLGISVTPVDTNALADGATLKFSKKTGTFVVS